MKTMNQNPGTSYLKIMLLSLLFGSVLNSTAQKINKAIEVGSDITGSGLGTNIYLGASLSKGNSSLNFAANFQHKKFNLSGIQLTYRYIVASTENEKTELFFLGNIIIHGAARISNSSIRTEQMCRKEESIDYNALSLKVIESYVGFGLKYNLSKKINAICSIGVGGYGTLNNDYDHKMYRPKSAPSLKFKAGLLYNISK